MEILKSASKIVFIALMLTACVTFAYEVFTNKATLEAKDFMVLAGGAGVYYFTRQPSGNEPLGSK